MRIGLGWAVVDGGERVRGRASPWGRGAPMMALVLISVPEAIERGACTENMMARGWISTSGEIVMGWGPRTRAPSARWAVGCRVTAALVKAGIDVGLGSGG